MRKWATRAVGLVANSHATGREQFQFDLAASYVVEWVGRYAEAIPEAERPPYRQPDWHRLVNRRPARIEDYPTLDRNEVVAMIREELPGLIAQLDEILGPEENA
jgi:uncharacterized protein with HEPN domain